MNLVKGSANTSYTIAWVVNFIACSIFLLLSAYFIAHDVQADTQAKLCFCLYLYILHSVY
jgi:hypothetical protein